MVEISFSTSRIFQITLRNMAYGIPLPRNSNIFCGGNVLLYKYIHRSIPQFFSSIKKEKHGEILTVIELIHIDRCKHLLLNCNPYFLLKPTQLKEDIVSVLCFKRWKSAVFPLSRLEASRKIEDVTIVISRLKLWLGKGGPRRRVTARKAWNQSKVSQLGDLTDQTHKN